MRADCAGSFGLCSAVGNAEGAAAGPGDALRVGVELKLPLLICAGTAPTLLLLACFFLALRTRASSSLKRWVVPFSEVADSQRESAEKDREEMRARVMPLSQLQRRLLLLGKGER